MLARWPKPPGRDQVMGLWRPIAPRSVQPAAAALETRIASLLSTAPAVVRSAAALAAAALELKGAGAHLAALALDGRQPDRTRAEALKALDRLTDPGRVDAALRALVLPGSRSRTEALRILAKVDPAAALAPLQDRLAHGSVAERQGAIAVLGAMPGEPARRELLLWLDRLIAGQVPVELQLDLIEAATARTEPEVRKKLEQYATSKPGDDPLAAYREVLAGGDPQRGMTIFTSRIELECVRCHKVKGPTGEPAGGEVGPELTGIGNRQTRTYLLEAILDPNKQIAPGFESVVLATTDGKVHTGILRGEDANEIRIMTTDSKQVAVPKDVIEERKSGPSAMPTDLARKLSRMELRDLIEFLANLKTP
jgi:quinoprotein glucose dehydrogenase